MIDDIHIIIFVVMKPKYITPRLAVARLECHGDSEQLREAMQERYKHYRHYFNLTISKLGDERESSFKWRGLPFSLSETLKIVTQIDTFLRANLANTAVVCVTGPHMHSFAIFALQTYLQFCGQSASHSPGPATLPKVQKLAGNLTESHPYLSREIHQIYRNIRVESPPVKILSSLVVCPEAAFAPIAEVVLSQPKYAARAGTTTSRPSTHTPSNSSSPSTTLTSTSPSPPAPAPATTTATSSPKLNTSNPQWQFLATSRSWSTATSTSQKCMSSLQASTPTTSSSSTPTIKESSFSRIPTFTKRMSNSPKRQPSRSSLQISARSQNVAMPRGARSAMRWGRSWQCVMGIASTIWRDCIGSDRGKSCVPCCRCDLIKFCAILLAGLLIEIKLLMSEEDRKQFSTPYRGAEEKDVAETAAKGGEESEIRREEEGNEDDEEDLDAKLQDLEKEIKLTQERLKSIKERKDREDQESEEYHKLENDRRVVRKTLIDLDYEHKLLFEQYKKRNQKIKKQQQQQLEKQILEEQDRLKEEREKESLERSRRLEQQLDDIKKDSDRRREELSRIAEERDLKPSRSGVRETRADIGELEIREPKQEQEAAPGEAGVSQQEEAAEDPKSLEQEEAEARHKTRVAEIELELATERLRRSRQVQLESELLRIRSDYQSYSWWGSYPYSYRLFLRPYELSSLYSCYPRYPSYPSYLDYPLYSPYRRFYPYI